MKALIPLALLGGCALGPPPSSYAPPPPLAATPVMNATAVVTVGIGGRASVNGVRVVPRRVVEDSRCPAGVQCVWAGRLILEVLIGTPGRAEGVYQMILGQAVPLPGGTLTLVAASPPKIPTGGPMPGSFTFEWRGH